MSFAETLVEARWIGGQSPSPRRRPEGGFACLGVFLEEVPIPRSEDWLGIKSERFRAVAAIIRRLWPERVSKDRYASALTIVIEFNDDPCTTWTDIEKVAREFDLDADLHGEA